MSKGGMTSCCLYLMYVFTFLFWLCGCAVLGVALYLRFNADVREIFGGLSAYYADREVGNDVDEIGTQFYFYYCYALMCLGGIIMFIGFIGCCGTIYESPCILCFFSFLLLLLMVVEIGGGGFGYYELEYKSSSDEAFSKKDQSKLQMWVSDDMTRLVNGYYSDDKSKDAMDAIQQRLKCCGAESGDDYNSNQIPQSCSSSYAEASDRNDDSNYQVGCTAAMTKFLREHVLGGLMVVMAVGVFQGFGLIASMCLCCGIRGNDDYSNA